MGNEHWGERPQQDLRYAITDDEAEEFLRRLANPDDELRSQLEENPRDTLLEHNLDIAGIPEKVSLPPAEEIETFIRNHLAGPRETNNVGYAILYFMLGAMPLVVADGDGTA
jgi:hypothetical protein